MDTKLSALEEHILAYYFIKGAAELNMDPRWWPPIELSSIVEDKLRFAVSRFNVDGRRPVDQAAKYLLKTLIGRGAFATSRSDYGPMYQFQRPAYQEWLAEAQATNPILAQAKTAGSEFWQEAFERLQGQSPA